MVRHVRRWGAVYVLFVLFAGSWIGQFFAMLANFRSEQRVHGEPFAGPTSGRSSSPARWRTGRASDSS